MSLQKRLESFGFFFFLNHFPDPKEKKKRCWMISCFGDVTAHHYILIRKAQYYNSGWWNNYCYGLYSI